MRAGPHRTIAYEQMLDCKPVYGKIKNQVGQTFLTARQKVRLAIVAII
jgi:hypothetical protein